MYELLVYYPEDPTLVRKSVRVDRGNEVVALIPKLLAEHVGCERIVVTAHNVRLFSVDCAGNRHP